MAQSPVPPGVSPSEWERLPERTRLLLGAGMADVDEVMQAWRNHWKSNGEGCSDRPEPERR